MTFVFVPSPNCPEVFSPHTQTFPSVSNAAVEWLPAEMAFRLFILLTSTGRLLLVVVLSPN